MAAIDTLVSAFDWWPSEAQMRYSLFEWARYGHPHVTPEEFFNDAEACLFMFFHCGFIEEWVERRDIIPECKYDRKMLHRFHDRCPEGIMVFTGKHLVKGTLSLLDDVPTTIAIRPQITYYNGDRKGGQFWRDPYKYLYCPQRCWVIEPREPYNKLHRRGRWTGARIVERPARAPLTAEEEKFGRKYDATPWDEATDTIDIRNYSARLTMAESEKEREFRKLTARKPPNILIASKYPYPETPLVQQFIDSMDPLPEPKELVLVPKEEGPPLVEPDPVEIDRLIEWWSN